MPQSRIDPRQKTSERVYSPGVLGHGSMNEQPGGMSGALSVTAHHMKNARRRTTGTSSRKMMPSTHAIQAGGWWKRHVGAGFGSGDDWWGNASPWIWGGGVFKCRLGVGALGH